MLYQHLASQIRAEFGDGRFSLGAMLPSENDLMRAFAVSRTTVRKALKQLENEGFVERRQGRGTFLCQGRISRRVSSGLDFLSHARRSGGHPGTRLLSCRLRPRSIAEFALFGEGGAGQLCEVVRLRLLNGEPCILQTSVLPFAGLAEVARGEFEARSLYGILERDYGIRIGRVRVREVLGCGLAAPETAAALDLTAPAAVFVSHRTAYDTKGAVVEVSRNYIHPDRYSFVQDSVSPEVMA